MADDSCRIIESFSQTLLGLLQNFGVFLQALVDVTQHLTQLLLNQLGALVQNLSQLHAELIDLLLHEQQRWNLSSFLYQRFNPVEQEPHNQDQGKKKDNNKRLKI